MLICSRTIYATQILLLVVFLCGSVFAGNGVERIVKKDGSTLTGEVMGFEDGNYSVRVGQDFVQVPASQVRTIEQLADHRAIEPTNRSRSAETFGIQKVMEDLALRANDGISADSVGRLNDAMAAIIRGEWDFSLRLLNRLLDTETKWVAPELVACIVHLERGEMSQAIRLAVGLERKHGEDTLALRVAGEVYRRTGFAHRHVRTMEKFVRMTSSEERVQYELAHLWWSIDPKKAVKHWDTYKEFDPGLRKPWCAEGEALRETQLALAVEDWYAAQVALDELLREFPWVGSDTLKLRVDIVESRLRSAEVNGHVEEVMLAAQTLQEIDPDRIQKWSKRLVGIQGVLLQQGLANTTIPTFQRWYSENAHLLPPTGSDWQERVSAHFQVLALHALTEGDYKSALSALGDMQQVDPSARPSQFDTRIDSVFDRIREEVELGRRADALQIAHALHVGYPDRSLDVQKRLRETFKQVMGRGHVTPELTDVFREIHRVFLPEELQGNRVSDNGEAITVRDRDGEEVDLEEFTELTMPAMRRYFPHTVGTRWVYRRDDGTHETRYVKSVTPHGDSGVKIHFVVKEENRPGSYDLNTYIKGTDLVAVYPQVPPGARRLRYPFADGQTWGWKSGDIRYKRTIRGAKDPLQLPTGTYGDYFVVVAENEIQPLGSDRAVRATTEFTYVAGVGLAKVESDDAGISKVLIEFRSPDR